MIVIIDCYGREILIEEDFLLSVGVYSQPCDNSKR